MHLSWFLLATPSNEERISMTNSTGGARSPNGDLACFNCNEKGHIVRNSSNEFGPKSFGENSNLKNIDFYKCAETGHIARNCSSTTGIRSNENQRNIQEVECYNCNNIGILLEIVLLGKMA